MIADTRKLVQDREIGGSVAIIGAGAAGITLAIELAKHFKDVLLLESGGLEFEQNTQDLYEGPVLGRGKAAIVTDLTQCRLRYLGGSTNHWTGFCAPMDAVDFETIPGRPYSGWPFKLQELIPFYERAYRYCEIGAYHKTPPILERAASTARQILDNPEFQLAEFRHSPPTRFGERYRRDLESSDRIKVYLHTNVTDIAASSNGEAISSVDARTLNGRKLRVAASTFILCCGGIENPRILLNCRRFFPAGIGNQHDLVGRFFMDNPWTGAGNIIPQDRYFDLGPMNVGRDGSIPVTVAFKNSAKTSAQSDRCGASLFLVPVFEETADIIRVRSSPSFKVIQEITRDLRHGQIPRNLVERSCIALEDSESAALAAYYRVTRTLRNYESLKAIFVRIEAAQLPNPDSRVKLINDIDALGMKRAALDWRISDDDRNNIYQTTMAFARGVGAAGFGRMIVDVDVNIDPSKVWSAFHHLGTTRMHDDSRQGVVDRNCQVHGLDNLFIGGSSVFPTGIRVNPTLTIVALAIRLADYLKLTMSNR